jgi:hypothetical protein
MLIVKVTMQVPQLAMKGAVLATAVEAVLMRALGDVRRAIVEAASRPGTELVLDESGGCLRTDASRVRSDGGMVQALSVSRFERLGQTAQRESRSGRSRRKLHREDTVVPFLG